MKAKIADKTNLETPEAAVWQACPEPLPTLTPRERLRQNIARLQSLDRELLGDPRMQSEILTAIELVGFKIRHLARQIQEAEQAASLSLPAQRAA